MSGRRWAATTGARVCGAPSRAARSEEHTSELQSRLHLVCRLLLEKKKKCDLRVSSCTPSLSSTHNHIGFALCVGGQELPAVHLVVLLLRPRLSHWLHTLSRGWSR